MHCNCVDIVTARLQALDYDISLNPHKGIAGRFRPGEIALREQKGGRSCRACTNLKQ
ncbi:MAG: hypothetical protein U9Q84_02275 [Thermodesulfobacteriota bacterium]|nr:hypothetical protein [Thermodesulfobacteriota bacterium]